MNKKSFMRGFGSGVLFAALILGISCMVRTSDSAVVRRARALGMSYGMQEETSLFGGTETSSQGAVSQNKKSTEKEASQKSDKNTAAPKGTNKVTSHKEGEDVQKERDKLEKEKDKLKKEMEDASKEFTVYNGDWSGAVSRRLEEMDIISNASDFDAYLERNGYSEKIRVGTFSIPSGASYEEIARAITGR